MKTLPGLGSLADTTKPLRAKTMLKRSKDDAARRGENRPGEDPLAGSMHSSEMTERANHRLQYSEACYDKLFSMITDAIFLVDTKGLIIVDVNGAAERMYGYTREEFLGKPIIKMGADEEGSPQFVDDRINGRDPHPPVVQNHRRKNGTVFPVEVATAGLALGDRYIICGIIRDISDRVKAERELEEINRQLQIEHTIAVEKNIALGQVLQHIDDEKSQIITEIQANIEKTLMPLVGKLAAKAGPDLIDYVNLLRTGLEEIASPFLKSLEQYSVSLTRREIEICDLIKRNRSSKEIAVTLDISIETVRNHRKSIRRKLGIANNKINLTTFLMQVGGKYDQN